MNREIAFELFLLILMVIAAVCLYIADKQEEEAQVNLYNMKKCKNNMGYSDTVDMLQNFSNQTLLQQQYFAIDMETILSHEESDPMFLRNFFLNQPYSRLEQMGKRFESPFSHMTDVSALVDGFSLKQGLEDNYDIIQKNPCDSGSCLMVFFNRNKKRLFFPCKDFRLFAHCQSHYLLTYSTKDRLWRSFVKSDYISKKFDLTLVSVLSYDRIDRLPYLFDRWKGPICLVFDIVIAELPLMDALIYKHINRPNTKYVLYVRYAKDDPSYQDYFINYINNTYVVQEQETPIFPINLLRSLGINAIETSHYAITDIDLLPSKTMYDNFKRIPKVILNDDKSAILFPAFVVNKDTFKRCREGGDCNIAWGDLPKDKKELQVYFDKNLTVQWPTPYYRIVDDYYYMNHTDIITAIRCMNFSVMEPYSITKRTDNSVLYNPYFINYGRNKLEYVTRLKYEGYKFYVLLQDFGFDIPHIRTSYAVSFMEKVNDYEERINDNMLNMWTYYNQYLEIDNYYSFPICYKRWKTGDTVV